MSFCPPAGARTRWPIAALAATIGLIALAGYLRTVRPTFGWGDSSELITAAYFLGIGHSPGYPTWMLLAYPFAHLPFTDSVALRLNVMNALLGAVAIGLFFAVYRQVAARTAPASRGASVCAALGAAVAALSLAFATTFWDVTTEADVFTLHACFVALILLTALWWRRTPSDRALFLLALLVGLGLTNHPLTSLMIPALFVFVWMEQGRRYFTLRRLALATGCLLLGLSFYLYLPIRGLANPPPHLNNPHSLHDLWYQLTAPGARETMFDKGLPVVLHRLGLYTWRLHAEFGWLGLALGLPGMVRLLQRDRRLFALFGLAAVVDLAYAVNFSVFDAYMYYLPLHLFWAGFVAAGAAAAIAWSGRLTELAARTALPDGRRYAAGFAILLIGPALLFADHLGIVDGRDDRDAEWFARAALEQLEPKSVLLGDWWAVAPVGYIHYVEGERRDVAAFPATSLTQDRQFLRYTTPQFMDRYQAVYLAEELTDREVLLRKIGCIIVPEGPVKRVYRRRPDPKTILADIAPTHRAEFGNRVALAKVDVEPGEVRAWETFDITLYWTPLPGYAGEPYDVTVSLRHGDMPSIWIETVPLAHDLYPLKQWHPGQVLRERHRIFLRQSDRPGEYQLLVRLRSPKSGRTRPAALICDDPAPGRTHADYLAATLQVGDPTPGTDDRKALRAVQKHQPHATRG